MRTDAARSIWTGPVFCSHSLGWEPLPVGGPPVIQITVEEEGADAEKPQDATTWKAHELPDTETIAKLTTGVKRFALPDEIQSCHDFQSSD